MPIKAPAVGLDSYINRKVDNELLVSLIPWCICLSVKTVTFLRLIDPVFLSLKKSAICVAVVVYRPGSSTVTSAFFTDLADLLDRLSVHTDPLVLAGDTNIRLERVTDSDAVEFNNLMSGVCVGQSIGCV